MKTIVNLSATHGGIVPSVFLEVPCEVWVNKFVGRDK